MCLIAITNGHDERGPANSNAGSAYVGTVTSRPLERMSVPTWQERGQEGHWLCVSG
jgi:hypothetical protein